eukprot:4332523-Ditylum_brightwellii.AAC.1
MSISMGQVTSMRKAVLFFLIKENQVRAVGRDSMVNPLLHVVHQIVSCTETNGGSLVGFVLAPIRHCSSAFILKDTPVEVFAYLVMLFHILGAVEHFTVAGNVGGGLVVFATQAANQ